MWPTKYKVPFLLSGIIALLAGIASAGGLFISTLYRDNTFIKAAWQGNDLITLLVAVPSLITGLIFTMRGSERAQLIWLGSLGYMLYNYLFYLYGAAFNPFFLIYVAIFSLSIYALILALMEISVIEISQGFYASIPVKWISSFMLFFIVPWGSMEIYRALSFVFTGQVPIDIVVTGHPTAVVYATDLSLIVPTMVVASILLWKRRPWGYLLSTILLFKGTTYGLALIAMSAFAFKATGKGDPLTPLYIFLSVGSLISLIFLLKPVKPAEIKNVSTHEIAAHQQLAKPC